MSKHLELYKVSVKENLLYKVIVSENVTYEPISPAKPKRGSFAFQTDLMVSREQDGKRIPLVVAEVKILGGKKSRLTTHDILVYSTKALKHKEVYPYLRYGLVIYGKKVIDRRFFIHNVGFDFAYALPQIDDYYMKELAQILKRQASAAEDMLKIFSNKKKVKSFEEVVKVS